MVDITAGAHELAALARRLTDTGNGQLRTQLDNGILGAVRPTLTEIRTGLPEYMPNRYAATLGSDLVLRTHKYGGVEITGSAPTGGRRGRMVRRLDQGILWHPLFGNRKHWYAQIAPGGGMKQGWFTAPAERSSPRIRAAIETVMRQIAAKIERG